MLTQDRLRRDLAWCLSSQPIMAADGWSVMAEDPATDRPLPAPRHAHHFRLGQHFEALLTAWLRSSPSLELLDHNRQVQDGKRTVGEFDFLVKHAGEVEHWEAAVKFYLGTGDEDSLACWFGPNTADRLDIKYRRLVDHQLRLAEHPAGESLLEAQGIRVARSRCFMKGRLFHPWQRFERGLLASPAGINPRHESGWWLSYADFLATFDDAGYRYVYLPKSLWLAPLTPADITSPLSFWEVAELLGAPQAEQAMHFAMVDERGEVNRGFIVHEQWLTRVRDSRARREVTA